MNYNFIITARDVKTDKIRLYFSVPVISSRQSSSFDAFFYHGRLRNQNDTYFFYPHHLEETRELALLGSPSSIELLKEIKKHQPIGCVDLWDFYDKIGYDRKKKKYI